MTARFKDHFSAHSGSYAEFRPLYPDALFEFLADACYSRDLAWDCGTGNGQAARSLAPHFAKIVATDASERQISNARPHSQIVFRAAAAEDSALDGASVDLITVAQALHWFDINRFFDEACRVLKPGGVLAAWCYERCVVEPTCNEVIEKIFTEIEPHWPPERDMVEDRYRSITLPVAELQTEGFAMHATWAATDMLGYMRTWSASQRYLQANGIDPVAEFEDELNTRWGSGRREVLWPITLKAGRK